MDLSEYFHPDFSINHIINSIPVFEKDLEKYLKYDFIMLELADFYGNRCSKDPSTKVGAVIMNSKDYSVISLGFNGFARGVPDKPEWLNNREEKYPRIIHAEKNAIRFARGNTEGQAIYVSSLPPCHSCASEIIQSGIKKCVTYYNEVPERWSKEMKASIRDMIDAGIDFYCLPKVKIIR